MKKKKKTTRLPAAERKEQIVQIVLRLADEKGVEDTTIARIAAAAGVTERALYRYFPSRHEMLLAALDAMYGQILHVFAVSQEPNVLDRIRQIGQFHSELAVSEETNFIFPFYEFLASPRKSRLRESIGAKQEAVIAAMMAIVEEGKTQGSIRPDVDPEQVAWEVIGVHWAEGLASLMGLKRFVTDGRSAEMLERILRSISTEGSDTGSQNEADSDPAAVACG